jgi:hypothetical protein
MFVKKNCAYDVGVAGTYYNNYFDVEMSSWTPWSERVGDYVEPQPFNFYEVFVPTTDSELYV